MVSTRMCIIYVICSIVRMFNACILYITMYKYQYDAFLFKEIDM